MSARRGFRLLWSSTAASNLADGMALVLLPLLALDGGATAAEVALLTVALTLAWPVLGLPAGWLVDRFPKRLVLAAGNTARALALGGMAVWAAFGAPPLAALLVTAVVYGVGETLVDTGINASVPALVPPAERTRAISAIEAAITVTNSLAGRPLAGVLVGLGFGLAVGSVALLYATAAVLAVAILALRSRALPDDAHAPALRLRDGLTALWRHPTLRALTVITCVANLVWGMFEAIFVVHAVAPGPLGLTPAQYGLVLSAGALGGIAASAIMPAVLRRVPATVPLAIDMVGSILLVLPSALGAPVGVVVAGIVVAAGGSTAWRIITAAYRQQELPEHLLGRAYSAHRVISWGSLPVGAALASGIAAAAGVPAVFQAATGVAVLTAVLFAVLLLRRPVRLRAG
jgi:Fucose permease